MIQQRKNSINIRGIHVYKYTYTVNIKTPTTYVISGQRNHTHHAIKTLNNLSRDIKEKKKTEKATQNILTGG